MARKPWWTLALAVSLTTTAEAAMAEGKHGEELHSSLEDQQAVAVTIYNQDLALVKDRRRIELPPGQAALAFRDVSAKIQPQTAILTSHGEGPGVHVLEQNFDFDLLTPNKLLEKYVGRQVGLIKTHPTTGEETEEEALVLAASNGVVLRVGDRIETGVPGRLVYREVPANLRDRPTLVMTLESPAAGPRELELSYLTGGLSWQADYVGELAAGEDQMDLTGWVTLTNQSGTSYPNAQLQLVAGEVNRVREAIAEPMYDARVMAMAEAAPPMAEEALFEYHLYTLGRPTTIADNQSKQVALLNAEGVAVRKELLVEGSDYAYRSPQGGVIQKLDVLAYLELKNDEASNLGMPLPAGTARIYKRDSQGNAQFIGEDRIDHTPKNETARLKLGKSFDVTAERKQTEFKKLSGTGPWQYQFESAYELVLRNAKPEPATVKVREHIPGDWTMLQESLLHTKPNAFTAEWRVEVPAEGSVSLSYRVRVRF